MVITKRLDDEGQYLELGIAIGDRQYCTFLVDVEPLGVDAAYNLATEVATLCFNRLGDGGGSAP